MDDTSIILKSLAKVINGCKNPNMEVIKAYDGVVALGLFKINYYLGKNIKYIVTDQNMTMMSGIDLLSLVSKYSIEKKTKLFISSSDDANLKGCKLEH